MKLKNIKFPLDHLLSARIVDDMNHILDNGWADKVHYDDLGHGHVCIYNEQLTRELRNYGVRENSSLSIFESEQILRNLIDRELDRHNIIMLYHTHELDGKESDPNRNIWSHPECNPKIISPSYANAYQKNHDPFRNLERSRNTNAITVYSRDINLTELFEVSFELDPQGKKILKDGTRINIYAVVRV